MATQRRKWVPRACKRLKRPASSHNQNSYKNKLKRTKLILIMYMSLLLRSLEPWVSIYWALSFGKIFSRLLKELWTPNQPTKPLNYNLSCLQHILLGLINQCLIWFKTPPWKELIHDTARETKKQRLDNTWTYVKTKCHWPKKDQ